MKTLKIIIICIIGITNLYANNSYNKSLAKNRAAKGIKGANYKVINGNKEFYKAQEHGQTIGTKVRNKRYVRIINYVEVKNVKLRKRKSSQLYGLAKYKKSKNQKRLYGIKLNKNFQGKVTNTVIIKNSILN